jgi:glutathione S-transferase
MAADLTLYWSTRSPFVRKVMVAAHELGLAERIRTVPTLVAITAPNLTHLAMNPLGRIPTLVLADGTTLYDSLAIIEYLNELAGGSLLPPGGRARLQALRWHALGNGLLEVLMLWNSERQRNPPPVAPHPAALEGFQAKTQATLDLLERESAALAATPFGIGQIAVGCALGYLDFRFAPLGWRTGRPGLAAWGEGFDARPSAIATKPFDERA